MKDFLKKIKKDEFLYTYGLGEFSYQMLGSFLFPTLLYFLTDIAMISVVLAGVIQIAVRVLKIFVSPLIGSMIDKRATKHGDKYMPWFRAAPVLYAASYVLMFTSPMFGFSGSVTTVIVISVYAFAALCDVAFYTSYNSLFPKVSHDAVKRSAASSSKSIMREAAEFIAGVMFPALIIVFAAMSGSDKASWALTCLVHGCICVAVMFVFNNRYKRSDVYMLDERKSNRAASEAKAPESIGSILKTVTSNRAVLVVFIVLILYCQRSFAVGPLKIYYYNIIVGNAGYLAIDKTAAGIAAIVVTPLVPLFVKLAGGTRRVYLIAVVGAALSHLGIWFVGADYVMFITLFTIGQVFMQTISVLTLNMFATASDYCKWKSGKDYSGSVMSLYSSGIQISVILAMLTQTIMLKSIGYVGGMAATPELLNGIMLLMSVYPAVFLLLAGVAVMFFPVNDKKYKEISRDLVERESKESSADKS
ncbi:MAG: MFS transporter [Clostridiales Family XIII bacterium]|jgi:GPH family glycoside/pentoside/hexuronide:cation symporter|nr:MFS transporter [Clostridiales Family XIII bacterium]